MGLPRKRGWDSPKSRMGDRMLRSHGRMQSGRFYAKENYSKAEALKIACRSNDPLIWLVRAKSKNKSHYRLVFGGVFPPPRATHKISNFRRGAKNDFYKVHGAIYHKKRIHELGYGRHTDLDCEDHRYDYAYRKGSERRRLKVLKGGKTYYGRVRKK